jgi:hypothetical protein
MDTTRQTAADRVHIELMDHAVLRRADINALERSTRQTGASWNGASVASRPQTDMPSLTHRKRGESIRGARNPVKVACVLGRREGFVGRADVGLVRTPRAERRTWTAVARRSTRANAT